MKLKLLRASVVDCITYPAGEEIDVNDSEARQMIAIGKAEEYTETPKKAKRATKKSPSNRMVEESEIVNRDAGE